MRNQSSDSWWAGNRGIADAHDYQSDSKFFRAGRDGGDDLGLELWFNARVEHSHVQRHIGHGNLLERDERRCDGAKWCEHRQRGGDRSGTTPAITGSAASP